MTAAMSISHESWPCINYNEEWLVSRFINIGHRCNLLNHPSKTCTDLMNPDPTVIDMLIMRLMTPLANTGSLINPEILNLTNYFLIISYWLLNYYPSGNFRIVLCFENALYHLMLLMAGSVWTKNCCDWNGHIWLTKYHHSNWLSLQHQYKEYCNKIDESPRIWIEPHTPAKS